MRYNQHGVSSASIIIFGLLTLTVVLINGISFAAKAREKLHEGRMTVLQYCGQTHERHPDGCTVDTVYQCGDYYLLHSNCLGVGDIVYDQSGKYIDWCGYTSLDTPAPACRSYRYDTAGNDCFTTANLCP